MTSGRKAPIFRRLDQDEGDHGYDYETAVSRNQGLINDEEQKKLRRKRVAIAGSSGVGNLQASILARLGIGRFVLADHHKYYFEHFNRHFGANCQTVGLDKVEVLQNDILEINPQAGVDICKDALTEKNMGDFLKGANLVLDCLGFSALSTRDVLIPLAQAKGIPVVITIPLGFSCAMLVFTKDSMSYERYFDFKEEDTDLTRIRKFAVGLAPKKLHASYMEGKGQKRGSFVATGVSLCGAMAANEVIKIFLEKGYVRAAPHYTQFDLSREVYHKGYLLWGNRNPLQKLKLWLRRKRKTSLELLK